MDRDQDKQPRKFTVTSKPIIPLDVDAVQPSASSSQSQGQTSSGSQSANIRPTFYQPPTQMVQLQGWHDPSVATSPSFQHQSAPFVPTPHSFFPPPPPPPQRTYVAPPSIALQDASAEDEDDMYAFHIAPARARTAQACEKCRVRKTKCSGTRPKCDRCSARGLTCEYREQPPPNSTRPRLFRTHTGGSGHSAASSSGNSGHGLGRSLSSGSGGQPESSAAERSHSDSGLNRHSTGFSSTPVARFHSQTTAEQQSLLPRPPHPQHSSSMASLDARFMSQSLQEQETEQGQGEGTSDVSRRVTAADLNLGSFSPLRRLASHDLGHDHELTPRGAPTTEQRSPMSSMFDQYINSPNFAVDGPTDEWGFADREGHHSEQGPDYLGMSADSAYMYGMQEQRSPSVGSESGSEPRSAISLDIPQPHSRSASLHSRSSSYHSLEVDVPRQRTASSSTSPTSSYHTASTHSGNSSVAASPSSYSQLAMNISMMAPSESSRQFAENLGLIEPSALPLPPDMHDADFSFMQSPEYLAFLAQAEAMADHSSGHEYHSDGGVGEHAMGADAAEDTSYMYPSFGGHPEAGPSGGASGGP